MVRYEDWDELIEKAADVQTQTKKNWKHLHRTAWHSLRIVITKARNAGQTDACVIALQVRRVPQRSVWLLFVLCALQIKEKVVASHHREVRRWSFSAHTGRYLSAECCVEDVCLFRHFIADGCVIISSCKDTASQPVWRTVHHTTLVFSERPLLPKKGKKKKKLYSGTSAIAFRCTSP